MLQYGEYHHQTKNSYYKWNFSCRILLLYILMTLIHPALGNDRHGINGTADAPEQDPSLEHKILGTPVGQDLPTSLSKGERFSDQVLGVITVLKEKIRRLEVDRDYDR